MTPGMMIINIKLRIIAVIKIIIIIEDEDDVPVLIGQPSTTRAPFELASSLDR